MNCRPNQKGFIFVTVLMMITVMIIIAVTMLSMNVSQALITDREAKKIQAELLATGAIHYALAQKESAPEQSSVTLHHRLDESPFDVKTEIKDDNKGIYDTQSLKVEIDY